MSWLRGALQRAADGGKSNLGRARTFAGSVVLNAGTAVAGRAKAVLERASLSGKSYNNFHHAVRRLDEVSLNSRGEERGQALARWLGALRELDRGTGDARKPPPLSAAGGGASEGAGGSADGSKEGEEEGRPAAEAESSEERQGTPFQQQQEQQPGGRGVSMVLFYDPDVSSEPLTFRDVFLRSNALQNITMSLILEPPRDEEVKMLLEMFGLCLAGGPELHHAILSGLQDLGRASAGYAELRTKRETLLQVAAECITGLKLNAEVERLDAEALRIEAEMSEKLSGLTLKDAPAANPEAPAPSEGSPGVLKDVPAELQEGASSSEAALQLGARLLELMERKEALLRQGDTEEGRRNKVAQVKALGEELTRALKEHKQAISESRKQKSDAMAYRVTKAEEVQEAEKVISTEMQALQRRKQELEAELKEVLHAIGVQTTRHIQLQEEKEAFDEASSNIVAHLAIQEEELARLITHHTADIGAASTWQNFLEDTWQLQQGCGEEKEKAVRDALQATRKLFWEVAIGHLVYRQEELAAHLIRLKMYNEELACMRSKKAELEKQGLADADGGLAEITSGRRRIEAAYVRTEALVKDTLVAVERAKAEINAAVAKDVGSGPGPSSGAIGGAEGAALPEVADAAQRAKAEDLLARMDVARKDFDALKRPKLEIEAPAAASSAQQRMRKAGAAKASEAWGQGVGGSHGRPGDKRELTPLTPLPGGAVRGAAGSAKAGASTSAASPAPPAAPEGKPADAKAGGAVSTSAHPDEATSGPSLAGQGAAHREERGEDHDGWEGVVGEEEGQEAADGAWNDGSSSERSRAAHGRRREAARGPSSGLDCWEDGGARVLGCEGAFPLSLEGQEWSPATASLTSQTSSSGAGLPRGGDAILSSRWGPSQHWRGRRGPAE